ncbi:unnamed protein product [Miscanthus lutarioriparius]|uniref:KIB1-4 beta-propeller domain-containing protein n=1 Tax=Miscanthus lutarioriparius TaxID=422564 RepID=A0A811QC82_9POAL|nr:unnamed protein product [Miscanthus lutarioriparius]
MADTTGTSWSDIPLDLAGRILHRLPAHVDRVRFGAVCPQWRATTRHGPLPPPLPLLLLSDARVYSLPGSEPFHFSGFTGTGYTDACGDWLVFSGAVEQFGLKAPPAASTAMKRRPKRTITFTHCGTDEGGILKDEDVLSPGTSLILKPPMHVGDESVNVATLAWMEMAERLQLEEEPKKCKLWLCSPNFIVATIKFTGGKRIAVCQAGATSWWSVCFENHCPDFIDMAFHQGKLYALDVHDSLFVIDVSMENSSSDPWISQMRKVIIGPYLHMHFSLGCQKRAYLVESRGVLLVVLRKLRHPSIDLSYAAERNEFEVFEADLSQSQWFKVTAIGNNEVLFLRRRCSRSVGVSHNALPGGCIFFLDNDDKDCSWYGASSSCCVYSMTNGKVSTPLPTVSWKPGIVFGTWLFPQS